MTMNWFDIIGYVGSVFIASSLIMKNVKKLRMLNMTGGGIFAIYGLIIQSPPVFVLNIFNASINCFRLYQLMKKKDSFTLLPLPDVKTSYLEKFLVYYQADIQKYFPAFVWDALRKQHSFFVLRNLIPVGLFIYEETSKTEIDVKLDYVIPDYRDFKNSSFTYVEHGAYLKEKGITSIRAVSTAEKHQSYLRRVGFEQSSSEPTVFYKRV